jgi:hypothetical protein
MPKQDNSQVPTPTKEQAQMIQALMHRVQSGIAFFEGRKEAFGEHHEATEPKHPRVGVNSALIECSAMASLLFRKGIITSEEYFETLIEFWEFEVNHYIKLVKDIHPNATI